MRQFSTPAPASPDFTSRVGLCLLDLTVCCFLAFVGVWTLPPQPPTPLRVRRPTSALSKALLKTSIRAMRRCDSSRKGSTPRPTCWAFVLWTPHFLHCLLSDPLTPPPHLSSSLPSPCPTPAPLIFPAPLPSPASLFWSALSPAWPS